LENIFVEVVKNPVEVVKNPVEVVKIQLRYLNPIEILKIQLREKRKFPNFFLFSSFFLPVPRSKNLSYPK